MMLSTIPIAVTDATPSVLSRAGMMSSFTFSAAAILSVFSISTLAMTTGRRSGFIFMNIGDETISSSSAFVT